MGSRLTRDQRMQVLFINFMRCNPKKFASDCLENFRQRFQQSGADNFYLCLDGTKAIKTPNGLKTLDACIKLLKYYKPVAKDHYIQWSIELEYTATKHVEDIGPLGIYGHESSIGLGIYDRLPENI